METIGIVLTFVIIAALTLWFIILGKGHWFIKAVVVAVALYFSFGIWYSLNNLSGWPSEDKMPEKFMLHWALVKEPSKVDINQKGNILLWATERLDEDNESKKKRNEPRVYKLPYSPDMHEKLSKIMSQMAQGKGVAGEKSQGQGNTLNGEGKKGKNGQKGYGSLSSPQDYIFYDLPPPVMPAKD